MAQIAIEFNKEELKAIKEIMLDCLPQSGIFIYLDNNNYHHQPNRYEAIAAFGVKQTFAAPHESIAGRWLFGHICYDYKNKIETFLSSRHEDKIGFEDMCWFEPKTIMYIPFGENKLVIEGEDAEQWKAIVCGARRRRAPHLHPPKVFFSNNRTKRLRWNFHFTKEDYLDIVKKIQHHIVNGDCYELNFCIEAFCDSVEVNPLALFRKINQLNPSPFAAFYRNGNSYLICASPERFIYKRNSEIIAQPIKGTIKRGDNKINDEKQKEQLFHSEKDRAENIMIVDLMRNDLAKCCEAGSVHASEIFGIYTFPHLHQMISTIKGRLKSGISTNAIIKNTFPMGSMTGAPKIKVMQLAEEYERSRRGIYSGTVGYINPDGNFDFNVVIRSLMYNSNSKYLSYHAGGAITYDSIPESEWEEIKLKAKAMEEAMM